MIPKHLCSIFNKPSKPNFLLFANAINKMRYSSNQLNSTMSHLNASTNIPAFKKDSICTETWFYTSGKKFEQEFTWIIKDYNLQIASIRRNQFKSPVFSVANDSCKWFLELKIKGVYESLMESPDPEWLFLNFITFPSTTTNVSSMSGCVRASLMDSKNKKSNTLVRNFNEETETEKFSLKFIKCCDLKNELSPEGELRIYFKISLLRDRITVSNHFTLDESSCAQDFEKLFNDDDFSDVIIDVGGKKYPAHKAILAARCPVFKAMFKNDSSKNEQNCVIEIKDIDENIFQEVLRYIYTGKVENLSDIALELMIVAQKYDLGPLKKACLNALSAST
ncbi:speckle-type POZ protein-like [Planococcus citri]|uniref:speckle-type POZ protein-like n=1 Tax=Planococcus citri TaxID=170843 RepID=UPI0031F78563